MGGDDLTSGGSGMGSGMGSGQDQYSGNTGNGGMGGGMGSGQDQYGSGNTGNGGMSGGMSSGQDQYGSGGLGGSDRQGQGLGGGDYGVSVHAFLFALLEDYCQWARLDVILFLTFSFHRSAKTTTCLQITAQVPPAALGLAIKLPGGMATTIIQALALGPAGTLIATVVPPSTVREPPVVLGLVIRHLAVATPMIVRTPASARPVARITTRGRLSTAAVQLVALGKLPHPAGRVRTRTDMKISSGNKMSNSESSGKKSDSTMGKLMEKAGGLMKNKGMEEKGIEKREAKGADLQGSGSGYGQDSSEYGQGQGQGGSGYQQGGDSNY